MHKMKWKSDNKKGGKCCPYLPCRLHGENNKTVPNGELRPKMAPDKVQRLKDFKEDNSYFRVDIKARATLFFTVQN